MATRVIRPTRRELEHQHARLVARTRAGSRERLKELASSGELTADEFWVWENIQSIEYLLGDDEDDGIKR